MTQTEAIAAALRIVTEVQSEYVRTLAVDAITIRDGADVLRRCVAAGEVLQRKLELGLAEVLRQYRDSQNQDLPAASAGRQ